ncbi:conserved hypothetical protein, partial [Ixodes scapularis]
SMPNLVRRFIGRRRLPVYSSSSEPSSSPSITSTWARSSSFMEAVSPEAVSTESSASNTNLPEIQISAKSSAMSSQSQSRQATKEEVSSIVPVISLVPKKGVSTSLPLLSGNHLAVEEIVGTQSANLSSPKIERLTSSPLRPASSSTNPSTVKPQVVGHNRTGIDSGMPGNVTAATKQNKITFDTKSLSLDFSDDSEQKNQMNVGRREINVSVRDESCKTSVLGDLKSENNCSTAFSSASSEAVLIRNDTLSGKGARSSDFEFVGFNVTTVALVRRSNDISKGASVTVSLNGAALKSRDVSPRGTVFTMGAAPTNGTLFIGSARGKAVLKGASANYIESTNLTESINYTVFSNGMLSTSESAAKRDDVSINGTPLTSGVVSSNGTLLMGDVLSTQNRDLNRGLARSNVTVPSKYVVPTNGTVHKVDVMLANDTMLKGDLAASPKSGTDLTYSTAYYEGIEKTVSPVSSEDSNATQGLTENIAYRSIVSQSGRSSLIQSVVGSTPTVRGHAIYNGSHNYSAEETTLANSFNVNDKLNYRASFMSQTSSLPSKAGTSSTAMATTIISVEKHIAERRGQTTRRRKYRRRYRKRTARMRTMKTASTNGGHNEYEKQTHVAARRLTRKSSRRKQNKRTASSSRRLLETTRRTMSKAVASSNRTESSTVTKNGTKNKIPFSEADITYQPKIKAVEITHRHNSREITGLVSSIDTTPFKEPRTVIPGDAYLFEDFPVKYQKLVTKAMSFVNSDKNIQAMSEPVVEVDHEVFRFDMGLFLTSLMSDITVLDSDTEFVEAAPNLLQHVQNLTASFNK